jgi:putative N6-adenine-specific DNA methylase
MSGNYSMVAKTLHGFEPILARELRQLGASNVEEGIRNVSFEGDTGFMYKANLCLRTAIRIYKPIATFSVFNEKQFYRKLHEIQWAEYISLDQTFAVQSTLSTDVFSHSHYVGLKAKDAIVDWYRETMGKRPSVDSQNPEIGIHVHIQKNTCTVSLDSSGKPLNQRGYRTLTNIAPINEVLAAGLVLLSGWNGLGNFMDPMCGSGTILIEAAMIACNIPPNINRKEYGFKNWPDYDNDLFEKITSVSLNKIREFHGKMIGYDKAPSAVRKAQENVEAANLTDYIQIERKDFFKTEKPLEGPLHMVFNPPYGERLQINVPEFYGNIGNALKRGYPGTEAWLITSNMESLKSVGLRPSRKIKVFNGKLESRFVKYEMYEGSKKASKQ